MQTIKIEFKIDKRPGNVWIAEKDRHGLRQLIDDALKRSGLGSGLEVTREILSGCDELFFPPHNAKPRRSIVDFHSSAGVALPGS
jgi:hypothetical protein